MYVGASSLMRVGAKCLAAVSSKGQGQPSQGPAHLGPLVSLHMVPTAPEVTWDTDINTGPSFPFERTPNRVKHMSKGIV